MTDRQSDEWVHYWMPVPGDARHAFRGARRWDGRPNAETVCGTTVPLATPSEVDWIHVRTCSGCWDVLTSEVVQDFDPSGSGKRARTH